MNDPNTSDAFADFSQDFVTGQTATDAGAGFIPLEPSTLKESGLTQQDIESLILKTLFSYGSRKGAEIAQQINLPFRLVNETLTTLKRQLFVGHRGSAEMGDYEYQLADNGIDRAKRLMEHNTYCGSAPVSLEEYVVGLKEQTIKRNEVDFQSIANALSNLVLSKAALAQVGQAVAAGRCLFLFGPPGNGKTSIARNLIRSLGDKIWIPRTITAGGEIIRIFDPNTHEEVVHQHGTSLLNSQSIDNRWILIKRPAVVVGGELNLDSLEATRNPVTGVLEAPIHIKSNGGCLVVDDFGRQRISSVDLFNRWIIPMERNIDYLTMPNGRHVEFPFDQLLVFSTNLNPHELCDEAFLRRIPYKVEVKNPTRKQIHEVFKLRSAEMGFEYDEKMIEGVLDRHFTSKGRPVRFCHAEDILIQVSEFCEFHRLPKTLTPESLDYAALNYFAGL